MMIEDDVSVQTWFRVRRCANRETPGKRTAKIMPQVRVRFTSSLRGLPIGLAQLMKNSAM
jgi:hypothetical protein